MSAEGCQRARPICSSRPVKGGEKTARDSDSGYRSPEGRCGRGGDIEGHDMPGKGCTFVIQVPAAERVVPIAVGDPAS